MKVLHVAEYAIRRASEENKLITNLKLQKTLYYIQGYSWKCFSESAFDDDIRNWQYGPVAPTAYFEYSSYGAEPLEKNDKITIAPISNEKRKLFDKVIDACLKKSARELVQQTHTEDPWLKTAPNEEITCKMIEKYFRTHNPLNIEVCS